MEGNNCIFCKIVNGEIPCFKVYEDSKYLAFLDLAHFTEGHTLLIPKEHVQFVWDVEYLDDYYKTAQKIANHYRKKLGYKYVDSATFGRDVPHSHIHLLPHNADGTDWEFALKPIGELQKDRNRWLSREEGERIAQKFSLL
ncbi:HIT domain-containing protein [Candidatus Dojkabacteria bacterium]|nr:HIT domain-containing protein [Candidatus Dojkabacteria bacterium]